MAKKGKPTKQSFIDLINSNDFAIKGFSYDPDNMAIIPFQMKVVHNGSIEAVDYR